MTDAKTRIVFTGDIVFCGYLGNGWAGKGCLTDEVLEFLKQADHVVGNVECPLTNEHIDSNRAFNLSGSPEAGKFLHDINIRNWNLANNHIIDCGPKGLLDTIKTAQECGCQTAGAGENEIQAAETLLLGDAIKVGILSVAQDWRYIRAEKDAPGALTFAKMELITQAITDLREKADWVVVVAHGGDEFSDMPMPYTRQTYFHLLDLGADIVIGHHPHVVQNYEYVGKKLIVYSLGNFIFDSDRQRQFRHTNEGMLVGLEFAADGFSMDGFPVFVNREVKSVEKGTVPAIFCDIEAEDYESLWPTAAKKHFQVYVKARSLVRGKRWIYKVKPVILLRYVFALLNSPKERIIQKGRFLSLFRKNKKPEMNDVAAYLNT